MNSLLKKIVTTIFISGCITAAHADDVCKMTPGTTTCGSGVVNSLSGNGMVEVNGTAVIGATTINGLLNASDAKFSSLDVNGSVNLMQCTITGSSEIKGSLVASSTKFENKLDVYSEITRFVNSKINGDLHLRHTDSFKQVVYLDNFSEVSGNIIFDDGDGEVIVRGSSKISGKVVGGHAVNK